MANVKFFRAQDTTVYFEANGEVKEKYRDGIFFSEGSAEILVNGTSYGGGIKDVKVDNLALNSEKPSETTECLVIELMSGTKKHIPLVDLLPEAVAEMVMGLSSSLVAESSAEKKNFLVHENENEENKLAVREVDADCTKTTSTFNVMGVNVGNLKDGDEIASGTDLEALLKRILIKIIDVEVKDSNIPTVALTGIENQTVEYGTQVSATLDYTFTDGSFTGLEGYDYTLAAGCSVIENEVKYFRDGGVSGESAITKDWGESIEEVISLSVEVGYTASTNIPKKNDGSDSEVSISKGKCQSDRITIRPAYKYFIGCYSDSTFSNKVYSVESIRTTDMKKSGWVNGTSINYTVEVPVGTKGMYIAIPKGIDDSGSTLDVVQSSTNETISGEMIDNKRELSMTCAGSYKKDYVIFSWSFPGGTASVEKFKITKF